MRRRVCTAVAAGALIAAAGAAQAQQTPANAQAFFKAVAEAQRVLLTDAAIESLPTQRIHTVESDACASRFVSRDTAGQVRGVWALNWREVRTSRLESPRQLRLAGPQLQWVLTFEGDEIAGRMLNAVNVVRRACDPTQGYGF